MSKTKEWFMGIQENGDLNISHMTEQQITKSQVDKIGEQFTEFVHKNYNTLQNNYKLNTELEDYISFPVFCYIEFSFLFNKDSGDGFS